METRIEQLKTYLHVQHLNAIGRWRHDILLERFGDLDEALRAPKKELMQLPGINERLASVLKTPRNEKDLEKEVALFEKRQVHMSLVIDPTYPKNLKLSQDGPILIQYRGQIIDQDQAAIAVVGSRECSEYARAQAYAFGFALAQKGFTVISGMARGVDSAAHRGALEAGGRTLAVQACGLNRFYPASARKLCQEISQNGAVISELPWDMPALRQHFPRRNRIISGLSLGTLVIEAGKKSGSLITARWALDQNREVFALPGRIDQPHSWGCHRLIQDGAKLVTCVDDILEEFPALKPSSQTTSVRVPVLSEKQKKVLALMKSGCENYNALIDQSEMTPGDLSLVLFQLESQKFIKAITGNRWLLVDKSFSIPTE